jgi:CheY-like chemotaxis protein
VEYIAPIEPLWCAVDEPQLSQVILNLLVNALQAAGARHVIDVELAAMEGADGPVCVIRIKDRGPGVPEDLRARLFEPFVSTKPGGSGLGLASALRIVQGHNGKIELLNRPGGGTCFEVYLPRLLDVGTEPDAEKDEELGMPLGSLPLDGYRVLVLDDEPRVLHTLGRILQGGGAKTMLFSTGEAIVEAQEKLLNESAVAALPPIFVLDLLLVGGIDGVETLRRLQKRDPLVRAIACSGYPPDPSIKDYKTIGFKAYLKKPFQAEALIRAVWMVAREAAPR